jgi:glycerate kinase
MRILIAIDKFKGSIPATVGAQAIETALKQVLPEAEMDLCPIADGGEGTAEAVIAALKGEWVETATFDAQNRPVTARYGLVRDEGRLEAIMEMSAASGLAMVSDLPLDPATASTRGTGLMLQDAIQRGANRIVIGIGGSATNDAGIGMAAALGFPLPGCRGRGADADHPEHGQLAKIEPPDRLPRNPRRLRREQSPARPARLHPRLWPAERREGLRVLRIPPRTTSPTS